MFNNYLSKSEGTVIAGRTADKSQSCWKHSACTRIYPEDLDLLSL